MEPTKPSDPRHKFFSFVPATSWWCYAVGIFAGRKIGNSSSVPDIILELVIAIAAMEIGYRLSIPVYHYAYKLTKNFLTKGRD